jgi:LysR family nitrogen assimilation transcriptional regulator
MALQDLNCSRLKVFLTVASVGNLSRAAKVLGTSQPSLSRRIAAIERDVGARLFVRTGRGIEPTETGEVLRAHAEEMVAAMEGAAEAIGQIGGQIRGEVRLGLPPTVAHVLAVPLIDALQTHFPEVKVTIMEGYSGHVLEWLSQGRVDIGVLYATRQTSDLHADLLAEEELHLIASPELAGTLGAKVTGTQVGAMRLVLPSRAHGLRQLVEERFAALGISLDVPLQVDAFTTTLRLVEAGKGCTILPRISIADRIDAGRLKALAIDEPKLRRRILLATSPAHQPSEAVRALAAFARRHSVELFRA